MTVLTLSHASSGRRLLQGAVALAGCVPVYAGLEGVLRGPHAGGASLDSHFRYLSGLLLGLGLAFWSCIPRIERRTALFRVLALIVVCGGLARAWSLHEVGLPGPGMRFALLMELGVTPALCLWQGRLTAAITA